MSAGAAVTLSGTYLGVRGTKRVFILGDSGAFVLQVTNWSTCNQATVRPPSTLAPGTYDLYVQGDGFPARVSEPVRVTVTL